MTAGNIIKGRQQEQERILKIIDERLVKLYDLLNYGIENLERVEREKLGKEAKARCFKTNSSIKYKLKELEELKSKIKEISDDRTKK